jgi:hypothetical protein
MNIKSLNNVRANLLKHRITRAQAAPSLRGQGHRQLLSRLSLACVPRALNPSGLVAPGWWLSRPIQGVRSGSTVYTLRRTGSILPSTSQHTALDAKKTFKYWTFAPFETLDHAFIQYNKGKFLNKLKNSMQSTREWTANYMVRGQRTSISNGFR